MTISETEFERANRCGQDRRARGPVATEAHFDAQRERVVVVLSSGLEVSFKPHLAQGLGQATPQALSEIEISPSGLGLHFPQLDADLYLPTLLEGMLGSRRWMSAAAGRIGGQKTSEAKATAARANGQLGGRPRKNPAI
ncbi:MAG: DUF2442 domain-containing protein [Thauera sp.]|jgi:hypothetical protein|nr:DUF2442 domain-containing protein [Thauera sp.]